MSPFLAGSGLFVAMLLAAPVASAACYDLSKSEPHELSGVLSYRIFAGPPGYEDVQKGDTPEPGYVLTLPSPICLTGDEFADPATPFNEVQLVETDKTAGQLAKFKQRDVYVTLERPMAAETGHHHRPLVAWVSSIAPSGDITEEYGTAASTVRAFYYALEAGDGDTAVNFIVTEKRRFPAFSADALTAFYGNLTEPLKLVDIQPAGADQYRVRYTFKGNKACDGEAIVTTTRRHGADFIKSINALNGC